MSQAHAASNRPAVPCDWNHLTPTPCSQGPGTAAPPRVLPRLVIEVGPEDMVALVTRRREEAVNLIHQLCESNGYDGVVLETWVQWASMHILDDDFLLEAAFGLLQQVATKLHSTCPPRELVLTVPPFVPATPHRVSFQMSHHQRLQSFVDGFSVMLYDHNIQSNEAGPNSPLWWVKQNLEAAAEFKYGAAINTTLAGLNFYGYDFMSADGRPTQPLAITSNGFLALLQSCAPTLDYNEEHHEHFFHCKNSEGFHTVYYPTPTSMQARLEVLQEAGVGLSIWELGQGLACFMDLL